MPLQIFEIFSANLALTAGILIHIVGFLVTFALVDDAKYASMSNASKVLLTLIYPNIGLLWGTKVMKSREITSEGLHWSNLFDRTQPDDSMTMGLLWILFFVNMLIFAIITWYIDSVHPGPYGVAKKWYFCFQVGTHEIQITHFMILLLMN